MWLLRYELSGSFKIFEAEREDIWTRGRNNKRMRQFSKTLESDKGATMIEYAIVLPLFLVLVMSILHLCFLSYQKLTLQYGISRAIRTIILDPNANPAEVHQAVVTALHQVNVSIAGSDEITFCRISAYGINCPDSQILVGDSKELMILKVKKNVSFPVLDWFGRRFSLSAEVVERNEPA